LINLKDSFWKEMVILWRVVWQATNFHSLLMGFYIEKIVD